MVYSSHFQKTLTRVIVFLAFAFILVAEYSYLARVQLKMPEERLIKEMKMKWGLGDDKPNSKSDQDASSKGTARKKFTFKTFEVF